MTTRTHTQIKPRSVFCVIEHAYRNRTWLRVEPWWQVG